MVGCKWRSNPPFLSSDSCFSAAFFGSDGTWLNGSKNGAVEPDFRCLYSRACACVCVVGSVSMGDG